MLIKIDFKEFKKLYKNHIVKDFPSTERPSFLGFRKRILKHKESVYIRRRGTRKSIYHIKRTLWIYFYFIFCCI